MKKLMTFALLSTILLGCSAQSKQTGALDDGTLTIGLDDTFAPMGFRDANNELVGFDVELAKAVAEKLNVKVEFQPIDWAMKETELNAGNIDCIWNGYSITDERKQAVAFSQPYLENKQIIVVAADSPIATIDDLSGQVVAVQKESSALSAIESSPVVSTLKDGAPVQFDTNIDCFMDLEAKRSNALVCDEVLARYVMKQRGEQQYKVLQDDFGKEEYGIGFRKNDLDTVEKVNQALDALQKDGTYDAIYSKWFSK